MPTRIVVRMDATGRWNVEVNGRVWCTKQTRVDADAEAEWLRWPKRYLAAGAA
jgi:hypothetical protein